MTYKNMDIRMNSVELHNAIIVRAYYSPEELSVFIENQKTKPLTKSGVYNTKKGASVDENYRQSQQTRVNSTNPFVEKLRPLVESVNTNKFKISITKYCNENDFVEYDVNGKFEQHGDVLWPGSAFDHHLNPIRKITTVVLLNNDFTGGKLALWRFGERYSFPFEPGDVISFPSYIHHKVDPVLTGTRYSLVSWSYGEF